MSRCWFRRARPCWMRFCEISLSEKLRKLCAKNPWRRSREITPGSRVMPSRALATVRAGMPLAIASLRKPSSHTPKLPVLRQFESPLAIGGAVCAKAEAQAIAPSRTGAAFKRTLSLDMVGVGSTDGANGAPVYPVSASIARSDSRTPRVFAQASSGSAIRRENVPVIAPCRRSKPCARFILAGADQPSGQNSKAFSRAWDWFVNSPAIFPLRA